MVRAMLLKVLMLLLALPAAVAENTAGDEACVLQASLEKKSARVLEEYTTEELLEELKRRKAFSKAAGDDIEETDLVDEDDDDGVDAEEDEGDAGSSLVQANSTKCDGGCPKLKNGKCQFYAAKKCWTHGEIKKGVVCYWMANVKFPAWCYPKAPTGCR
eukprot:TRINITY_DN15920_c0_g1_i1.p1 TRINITY_DN15920_c0_g1~~TRINITY_DN15920_c0_g1_i1.p1  ORF type:complete len:159 (+),score=40.40 TRINITY_DN15920_c0_g1_i1:65-541(+)